MIGLNNIIVGILLGSILVLAAPFLFIYLIYLFKTIIKRVRVIIDFARFL